MGMRETLINEKTAQLKKVISLLEMIQDCPKENLEQLQASLVGNGGETICPKIVADINNELHPVSIESLTGAAKFRWHWSAHIGRYLFHRTGEPLEKVTGVVLPSYSGTIQDWNQTLISVVSSMIRECFSSRFSYETTATIYA
jgi:hypothetical protein